MLRKAGPGAWLSHSPWLLKSTHRAHSSCQIPWACVSPTEQGNIQGNLRASDFQPDFLGGSSTHLQFLGGQSWGPRPLPSLSPHSPGPLPTIVAVHAPVGSLPPGLPKGVSASSRLSLESVADPKTAQATPEAQGAV